MPVPIMPFYYFCRPGTAISTTQSRSSRRSKISLNRQQSDTSSNTPAYGRFKEYKRRADEAQRAHKTFTIYGGYHSLRNALLKRGWVEKLNPNQYPGLQRTSNSGLLVGSKDGNAYEVAAISKLLGDCPPYFIWQPKHNPDLYGYCFPFRNRLRYNRQSDFTTKDGLVNCAENLHWVQSEVAEVSTPRSFKIHIPEEFTVFIENYRLTACVGLLRFLAEYRTIENLTDRAAGTISIATVDFAIRRIREHMYKSDHHDIDFDVYNPEMVGDSDWKQFVIEYTNIVKFGAVFNETVTELQRRVETAKVLLIITNDYWPSMKYDGYFNLWILKPGNNSRGIGVMVMSDMDRIIRTNNSYKQKRYIAQKYIERPMLIYGSKFDIRQYYLAVMTSPHNLQLWMYKTCYLRFSSQSFDLSNNHESVHLTNHAVQKKYRNSTSRHPLLPGCNMWNLAQFQTYLSSINELEQWDRVIYPGMKRNVIGITLCAQDDATAEMLRVNCFELYGCDFMLTDDYVPYLIEINATPDLAPSTSVTREICSNVLEDLVKVVIDRCSHYNPRAPTGNFELIYEIEIGSNVMQIDPYMEIFGATMRLNSPMSSVKTSLIKSEIKSKKSSLKQFFARKIGGKKKSPNSTMVASTNPKEPDPDPNRNGKQSPLKQLLRKRGTVTDIKPKSIVTMDDTYRKNRQASLVRLDKMIESLKDPPRSPRIESPRKRGLKK